MGICLLKSLNIPNMIVIMELIFFDTDTVIEMVNSFVWDDSDLFNGSVAVVEAAIAELFLKFLHLMSLPTDDYWAVNDFADDQCRGPSVKEKDHLAW